MLANAQRLRSRNRCGSTTVRHRRQRQRHRRSAPPGRQYAPAAAADRPWQRIFAQSIGTGKVNYLTVTSDPSLLLILSNYFAICPPEKGRKKAPRVKDSRMLTATA